MLTLLLFSLFRAAHAAPPDAAWDETFADAPPQYLAPRICRARADLADAKASGKLKGPRFDQAAAMLRKAEAYYRKKTGNDFPAALCRKVDKGPEAKHENGDWSGTTAAKLQEQACREKSRRTMTLRMIPELHADDLGPPEVRRKMWAVIQKQLVESNDHLRRLAAAFLKTTQTPLDTKKCVAVPGENGKLAYIDGEITQGCFYFMGEPFLEGGGFSMAHNFLGAIVREADGKPFYYALGECHKKDCSDEVAFLERKDQSGMLGAYVDKTHETPACTDDTAKFDRAYKAAHAAIHPEDPLLPFEQGAGFLLVPFTCGYSKPCGVATRRGWAAVKKILP